MNNLSILLEGFKAVLQWSDQYASRKLLAMASFVSLLAYGVYAGYVGDVVGVITGGTVVIAYIIVQLLSDVYEK